MQLLLLLQQLRWEGRRLTVGRVLPRLRRPLLAPWYRLVPDGERLLLEHGRSVVCFEGAAVLTLLPALLPLLDGARTVEEVVAEVGEAARPAVEQALELLEGNGLLVEGPPASFPAGDMLAAAFGVAPAEVERRLGEATVAVVGGGPAAAGIARLLAWAGVGCLERPGWDARPAADLTVVAPAPDETPHLARWNELALDAAAPWLPVRPFDGAVCPIGPLVVPWESACFECLLLRLGGHLEYGRDIRRLEAVAVAASSTPPLEAIAAGVAAHLALAWLGGRDLTLPGALHVLETHPGLTLTVHPVLRVPRCPACSHVDRMAPPLPWHPARPREGADA